ncbi:MAG: hypothetical protein E7242_08405 [Lachnospiraceae bacterium]|nr:hypothetical protein [Lachnospiraceae bacterium]
MAVRKIRFCMAFVMIGLLITAMLPISVKAQSEIVITKALLDEVRTNGEDTDNDIEYVPITDQADEGIGSFVLYKNARYVLGEDIELTGEVLRFQTPGASVLDLANFNLERSDDVTIDDVEYGTITVENGSLEIFGDENNKVMGDADIAVLALHEETTLTIYGGYFDGAVQNTTNQDTDYLDCGTVNIYDGYFATYVGLGGTIYISDGIFNFLKIVSDAVIDNGEFNDVELGRVDGTTEVVINNGAFDGVQLDEDGGSLYAVNVELTINGGFFGSSQEGDDIKAAICAEAEDNQYGSLKINDGLFEGIGLGNNALYVKNMDYVEINAGGFYGMEGALVIKQAEDSIINLAGGDYFGVELGAIMLIDENGLEYDENSLNALLMYGYEYAPTAQINELKDSSGDVIGIYSQNEIYVVPKTDNTVINTENEGIGEQVLKLIDSIKAGQKPEGVSDELAEAIMFALSQNKEITINTAVKEVTKESVSDDAAKIDALLSGKGTITGYFDINVEVWIDNEHKGNITKFPDGISISLPIQSDLQQPNEGMQRNFKILRVHNGVATELAASQKDGFAVGTSDSFSTYALAYEDVAKSPQTGDTGYGIQVLLLAVGAVAVAGAVAIKKKKESAINK